MEAGRQSVAHDGIRDMVRNTLTEREEMMGVSRLRFADQPDSLKLD